MSDTGRAKTHCVLVRRTCTLHVRRCTRNFRLRKTRQMTACQLRSFKLPTVEDHFMGDCAPSRGSSTSNPTSCGFP